MTRPISHWDYILPLPLVKIVALLRLLQVTFDQHKDFAGKQVYLNFWEMTNGLCLRDLAYAKELMRTLEGRNIVFINIALDENEGAWCPLVTAKKLPGVHLRLAGGLRAALAQLMPCRRCLRTC